MSSRERYFEIAKEKRECDQTNRQDLWCMSIGFSDYKDAIDDMTLMMTSVKTAVEHGR